MRRLAALGLALALTLISPPVEPASAKASATGFVAGTEDVPLMSGLRNIADSLVVFDKPEGRIVEVEARGRVTRAAVERFYAATLPQLGWTADGPRAWHREEEGLRLDFKGRDGDLRVDFTLSPR
ncbi:MAG: hypothetical protein JO010_05085 [Alphaproteobacteria bacterium]|nr:hypothetical protein [Alphaproteobacteria bacterium]